MSEEVNKAVDNEKSYDEYLSKLEQLLLNHDLIEQKDLQSIPKENRVDFLSEVFHLIKGLYIGNNRILNDQFSAKTYREQVQDKIREEYNKEYREKVKELYDSSLSKDMDEQYKTLISGEYLKDYDNNEAELEQKQLEEEIKQNKNRNSTALNERNAFLEQENRHDYNSIINSILDEDSEKKEGDHNYGHGLTVPRDGHSSIEDSENEQSNKEISARNSSLEIGTNDQSNLDSESEYEYTYEDGSEYEYYEEESEYEYTYEDDSDYSYEDDEEPEYEYIYEDNYEYEYSEDSDYEYEYSDDEDSEYEYSYEDDEEPEYEYSYEDNSDYEYSDEDDSEYEYEYSDDEDEYENEEEQEDVQETRQSQIKENRGTLGARNEFNLTTDYNVVNNNSPKDLVTGSEKRLSSNQSKDFVKNNDDKFHDTIINLADKVKNKIARK